MHPLISRFPGSKRRHLLLPGVLPNKPVDVVLEPFAGSGAFSHSLLQGGWAKRAIVGESDPLVRSIWDCWQYAGQHQQVLEAIAEWKERFCQNGTEVERDLNGNPIRLYLSPPPIEEWEALKEICEYPHVFKCWFLAAASLVLRKLTFGGVVRFDSSGDRLNIKYVQGQFAKLARWRYQFPPIYPTQVLSSARSAIDLVDKNAGTIAAWVDPPYYLPRADYGRMCPSYPGHQPHDLATLDLGLDALMRVAALPNLGHLVYSNYSSPEHDQQVERILRAFDHVQTINCGRMDTMHRANGNPSVMASERIWIAQRTEIMGVQKQLELI